MNVRDVGVRVAGVRIEAGCAADYRALQRHHYRAGPPATWARVLRAVDGREGVVAGVLVVSMPTLHGSARRRAWPGVFESRDPARAAAALRRELRTISRVVVDPRYRGLGIATALVRAYLARPLTPRTEAVAAMGPYCGFFSAAGMRPVEIEPHRRHVRLRRALREAGVSPEQLLEPQRLGPRLGRGAALRRELRAWARAARPPRELARARVERLARAAGMALLAQPRAYVAWRDTKESERDEESRGASKGGPWRSPESALSGGWSRAAGKPVSRRSRRPKRRRGRRVSMSGASAGGGPAIPRARARRRPTRCTRG